MTRSSCEFSAGGKAGLHLEVAVVIEDALYVSYFYAPCPGVAWV